MSHVKRDHNELVMWFIEPLDAGQGVSYSGSIAQVKILTHQANSSRHCDEQDRLITRTCTRFQQSRVNKGVGRAKNNILLGTETPWSLEWSKLKNLASYS